jgi:hypothetical protein
MTFRNVVLIRHKVANYRKWKAVFDAYGSARREHGCEQVRIFRRADNPKELVVMLTWSDLGRAREYVVSDDLRGMLADAPLLDRAPDVYLLEELEQVCPPMAPDQRLVTAGPSGTSGDPLVVSSPPAHRDAVEQGPLAHPGWAR